MESRRVAIVLPPKEGFSPGAVGAIGLLVHRLAASGGACPSVVVGAPLSAPAFADVAFLPAPPPVWPPFDGLARYAVGVSRVLRGPRPALIEVHNRPEVALVLARRFPQIPVTLFLHNDPQGMRRARTAAERAALLGRLARVASVSGFLRARLLDGVADPVRPPVVLPNCIDLAALPPSVPPSARDRVFLFAGRVVADKGADLFVNACARVLPRLPGWRAEMIGADRFSPDSPETGFLRELRPRAEAAGVRMLGYRPHAEVLAAMARAAVVTAPSRWQEPFGLTALEAMASGAALVCTARGGLPEVAGEAALMVEPDAAALAEAMLALARDDERRYALSAAGRERARRFDVPPAAARLDALRAEILDA